MVMTRQQFISLILDDERPTRAAKPAAAPSASPGDGVLFDASLFGEAPATTSADDGIGFARTLLEGSGFGDGRIRETAEVILGDNPAKRSLPQSCWLWPKTSDRPHRTLLFQLENPGSVLLEDPLFRELRRQKRLEDALHRLIQTAQEGFAVGGGKRTADVEQGQPEETLILVSVDDDRKRQDAPVTLVCFGTVTETTGAFEAFHITNEARQWAEENRALAEDHLSRLYYRHFEKLASERWQDGFVTGKERDLARKLLDVCTAVTPDAKRIEESAVKLIRQIATSFGRGHQSPKIEFDLLPKDHFIGADPKAAESSGFENDFAGMTVRDGRKRLLGYIVYCVDEKRQADRLRGSLRAHNSFHNVLVVYPDGDEATLELWQGKRQLTEKLTKAGAQFRGEGAVVNLLSRFFVVSKSENSKPEDLARDLAHRAKYLKLIALGELRREQRLPETQERPVVDLFEMLGKDLLRQSEVDFADTYAQTLTYCLLAARWAGKDADATFSVANVGKFLSGTGTLLTGLFERLIALRISPRLGWLIEDLVSLLHRTAVKEVFAEDDQDPVIHFYEPFLAEYDQALKNSRGVFYTPQPVVSFIVRSAHELLKAEFGLSDGLADTTTWGEMVERFPALSLSRVSGESGELGAVSAEDPFVKLLDPATGTATFLVEAIDVIHRELLTKWEQAGLTKRAQHDAWQEYVPKHLLTRVYAFELMMAPYAIAHLKVGLKLAETGYQLAEDERARIYLTNALEPWAKQMPTIGFEGLAHEAATVSDVKRISQFTVVVGNPPYSVSSWNTGEWITALVEDYKRTVRSEESQIQALSNDYIKFLRFGQWIVETTGAGILGMITGHGYLQGTQPRDLRKSVSEAFDGSYCIDLHGSVRRAGTDAVDDEPVFQIMTGVAIIVGYRRPRKAAGAPSGATAQASLVGPVHEKLDVLSRTTVRSLNGLGDWHCPVSPYYHFAPSNTSGDVAAAFRSYVDLPACFGTGKRQDDKETYWATGFASQQDQLAMSFTRDELNGKMRDLEESQSFEELRRGYRVCTTNQWNYEEAKKYAKSGRWRADVGQVTYRPFDRRWTVLHKHVLTILRKQVMSQLGGSDENIGLVSSRAVNDLSFAHCFVVDEPVDKIFLSSKTSTNAYVFPLYYESEDMYGKNRRANFSRSFGEQLGRCLDIGSKDTKTGLPSRVAASDIFNYIYAVLNSPGYRARYAEFLKIDFPRIPMPNGEDVFRGLSGLGRQLVALHLQRGGEPASHGASHIGSPSTTVEKISYSEATVWIDKKKTAGFTPVFRAVWELRIGGYQVCEKWLKDRKRRSLSSEDIVAYRKMVASLSETIRVAAEIDAFIAGQGGWTGAFCSGDEASS